jgi:hypothetical protein
MIDTFTNNNFVSNRNIVLSQTEVSHNDQHSSLKNKTNTNKIRASYLTKFTALFSIKN